MRLILLPEVREFLKTNKVLTREDLKNKMYEEFNFPFQKSLVLSTLIKKDGKEFSVLYETTDSLKSVKCIYLHEINTDPNAITIREYHEKMKKEKTATR
ncbi:hypothetical protein SAMN04244560_01049 [Thermoanaerobacter thermohydrosulfuricus]|uniref:DUF4258 domain-containing protein n=1 Tax=Thermoanaerobacter thermohydrosulfuricus TaxID=1516 RepID=A0A1G7MZN5_THETY|nr:hypothetical protein [Thermoanaerobacter thermohydrosulfuricus]SDF66550.1 hypothetical protein SAMN04244560_01049 [Thermoanaerobacter thermohydrosulfuricus]